MRQIVNQELFAYWDRLRAGRAAPERSAVDPAAIRNLLAYTFLLEIETGSVAFRLSGTRLNALFHRDLKGTPFAAVWAKGDLDGGARIVEAVLDDGTPTVAALSGGPAGYDPIAFELLMLPLRHHGRTHRRLLGAVVGTTVPIWSGLKPIEGFRLLSFRTIRASDTSRLETVPASPRALVPFPAPTPAPPPAAGRARVGTRPWPFRVYDGGLQLARPAPITGEAGPGSR